MFTPEGHQLEPCDMTWWSLTCNIAREWRLMMAEAAPRRPAARKSFGHGEIQRHLPSRSAQNSPRTTVRRA
ncbi:MULTISPECIES: hypothetical protein [Stenotrophomonas]